MLSAGNAAGGVLQNRCILYGSRWRRWWWLVYLVEVEAELEDSEKLKYTGDPYTASPLDGYGTPGNRITVSATAYPITVGGGGAGGGSKSR